MERIILRPKQGSRDGRVRMGLLNAHTLQHVDIITVGIPEMSWLADAGRGIIPGKRPVGDTAHSGCCKGSRRPEIRGATEPERKERGRGIGSGVLRKKVCGGVFRPIEYGACAA